MCPTFFQMGTDMVSTVETEDQKIDTTQVCVNLSSTHRGGVRPVCIWSNGEEWCRKTHLSKWDHIHGRVARGQGMHYVQIAFGRL